VIVLVKCISGLGFFGRWRRGIEEDHVGCMKDLRLQYTAVIEVARCFGAS